MDTHIAYGLLFATGLLAGITNAIAGGGTFFTFPVLIWVGVSPLVANTTNMLALLPANLAALPALRNQLGQIGRSIRPVLFAGSLGSAIGAILLLWLGADIFASLVPYLIGFATILFATAPAIRRILVGRASEGAPSLGLLSLALIFGFCIYGGYFGAGLGQILLAALILVGFSDLNEANALKNIAVFAVGCVAVVIFGLGGSIHWPYAIVMMISSTIGGYLGGMMSIALPQKFLRTGIICFGACLTIYYFLTSPRPGIFIATL